MNWLSLLEYLLSISSSDTKEDGDRQNPTIWSFSTRNLSNVLNLSKKKATKVDEHKPQLKVDILDWNLNTFYD